MKVLLINTSECVGGAAVAARRLKRALLKIISVNVKVLVRDKQTADVAICSIQRSWFSRKVSFFRFLWERLIIFIANFFSRQNLFQVSIANTGNNVIKQPVVQEADIIHLHWINQGFLSLSDLKKLIASGKPVVWTLHDLWPATAICHYPDKCEKYQSKCSQCPLQVVSPLFDLAAWTYRRKKKIGLDKVHFVGCSRWITEMAEKSSLLEGASFTSIPNSIDTSVFKPRNKSDARVLLHLPEDKSLLLFAAAKLSDKRKGANYLIEACSVLKQCYTDKIEIVLMGNGSEELCRALPFKVNSLGYISDQATMVAAYSCADLFVIPSLEDNLPNTIMESMACGTPCVGFATGGIPEMIDHKINGYVANCMDASDLANGIQWILEHKDWQVLSDACVKKVQVNYAEEVVAKRYIELYKSII
ncbi:glycosyltransferase family 4 protein [uncultured Parabacteroides sp.]|uniref:glycosyltransferase family 4 protein n=1 Tax=uncultured Parabacteroides sp. TaxID=512312 RepID=UPI0025DC23DB|nr:glycosyltransferase family 4 protein [uncultured Parabacteroides sp.]